MKLTEHVNTAKMQFKQQEDLTRRLATALILAKRYKIEPPEVVLMFTHPELSQQPIAVRCQTLGITEEQFMLTAMDEPFRRFMKDYQALTTQTLRIQATDKLSAKVREERHRYDKEGNATSEDLDMEIEVMKSQVMAEKAAPPPVNVQFNMFDEARRRIVAEQSDVVVIE